MMFGRTFCKLLALFLVFKCFSVVFIDGEGVDILGIGVGKHGGLAYPKRKSFKADFYFAVPFLS